MIFVNEPNIGDEELALITECVRSGWISSAGRYLSEFEKGWAAYCGRKFGVAVCNGTVALSAAVAALNLQPGDEVIMPSFTIISTALAVVENGGIPVLVDCDSETWTMDINQVVDKITSKTRAIMPVHIYGHPVEMGPLLEIAAHHNLAIIEDAAEAHGAMYQGEKCGSFGEMSCFSFYANKIITTGEGGMVLTDDPTLYEALLDQRNLAFKKDRRFYHTELGHNYRMTNMQAAIGVAQLSKIEAHIHHKRWMAEEYQKQLSKIKGLQLPVEKPWAHNVYWMYGLVLDDKIPFDAVEFANMLHKSNIETRPFFLGMHEQPVFHRCGLFLNQNYPVTERISRRGLYLPSGLTITKEQIDRVCLAIHNILK